MRPEIEAAQFGRLRELLAAILPANRFYNSKLGGPVHLASLAEFAQRVPFTRKEELSDDQLAHPPYGSNLTFPVERYVRFSQTSGSTGKPLRWLDTPESWDWMVGNWTRVFQAAGVTARDRVFFAFSFAPFLGFWVGFDAAERLGCLCIPGGGMRTTARLQAILENQVTVLCCTPTYALYLAQCAANEKIDLRPAAVRTIITAGEPGASNPATRSYIEASWNGARLVDHHGMTETGPVSYGCPVHPDVLHVIESSYIAEIVDPQRGHAVPPGTVGELVLTTLGRIGSPLLRYRTGDLVRQAATQQCECGTYDLALSGGIVGRIDDMVVVRGVNVYPSAVEEILRATGGVAEHRVEVRTATALLDLHVEVEPDLDHADDPTLPRRIEEALHNALSLRIPVSSVPPGTLPRFEMKARRWFRC